MQAQLLILGLKFRTKINRSLLAGFDCRVDEGVCESDCKKFDHGLILTLELVLFWRWQNSGRKKRLQFGWAFSAVPDDIFIMLPLTDLSLIR